MRGRNAISRRSFLSAAACGCAVPVWVRPGLLSAPAPSDVVTVGFIGAGGRAQQLMRQLPDDTAMVAVNDCYLARCGQALERHGAKWDVYHDYRALLERKDIEAVVVATTDHGRAIPCIHACQAGKDVYAEKPLTLTLREGRAIVNAARRHRRVFQVGTQQRSMEMNEFACRFVRTGGIGKVRTVLCCNYTGPGRYTGLPEQPVPEGLDWDAWCNRTELRPYNASLHLGWMAWRSYSGGEMTNWGAHGLDQMQWALGMCESGPIALRAVTPGPNGQVHMRYEGGIDVKLELAPGPMGGCIVIGDKGRVEIDRNRYTVTPAELAAGGPDAAAAARWSAGDWPANGHLRDWIMCVKTRKRPVADVEIGHRSVSVCHLANIAREVGRPLVWNPAREAFVGDEEADTYLERPRRKGYELPAEA